MFTIPVQKPLTPGEILERHFMEPLGLTQMQLADLLHVQRRRINEITNNRREVTPDTAIRLSRLFPGVSPQFWLMSQMRVNLWEALHNQAKRPEYEEISALSTLPVTPTVRSSPV